MDRIARRRPRLTIAVALAGAALAATCALALEPAQKQLADAYMARAAGDAARGKAFFLAQHGGGKPDTPSCASCHTSDPAAVGRTRAGKEIAPMAASRAPKRFVDQAETEKWFKRNCADVLGRDCTAQEKSDVLAFLLSI